MTNFLGVQVHFKGNLIMFLQTTQIDTTENDCF